jgi:hypothetical protein
MDAVSVPVEAVCATTFILKIVNTSFNVYADHRRM